MFGVSFRTISWTGAFLLVVIGFSMFSLRPVSASNMTVIDGDTEWGSDWTVSGEVVIRGLVIIPRGIVLTIAPGSVVEFDGGNVNVEGSIDFRGTTLRPVEVRSKSGSYDGHTISVSGDLRARNTIFRDGGAGETFLVRSFFIPTAYAVGETGVIHVSGGGSIDVAHCRFQNNETAVTIGTPQSTGEWHCVGEGDDEECSAVMTPPGRARVWASAFASGERKNRVININGTLTGSDADFRYNYWNGEDPEEWERRRDIVGKIWTDNFSESAVMRDPVVIAPGIGGSWQWTPRGEFYLDPVTHTYDSLVKIFEENGYVEGKDLFLFPYDWRQSNAVTALQFRAKLQEIRETTHWPLVDVVAHSMGGLVARQYVDVSKDEVDKVEIDELVTLGTPHNGAPESYLTWEAGKFGFTWRDSVLKFILSQEAKENNYEDIFSYVRGAPIVSIRELLPIYNYLQRKGSSGTLDYPDGYPRNTFLENLSSGDAEESFRRVTHIAIEGSVDDKTIVKLRVGEAKNGNESETPWKHGEPDGYNDTFGDHGIVYGTGDGTVPKASSNDIFFDTFETVSGSHGALPDNAKELVYREITGYAPGKQVHSPIVSDMVVVQAMSPIDIAVTDAEGRMVGSDPVTGETRVEIPGAFYTGGSAQSEFVTIPNPGTGAYRVVARGTDAGSFAIRAVSIRDGETGAQESVKEFSGTTQKNAQTEYAFSVGSDGAFVQTETGSASSTVGDDSSSEDTSQDGDDDKKDEKKKSLASSIRKMLPGSSEENSDTDRESQNEISSESVHGDEKTVSQNPADPATSAAASANRSRFLFIFFATSPLWVLFFIVVVWKIFLKKESVVFRKKKKRK